MSSTTLPLVEARPTTRGGPATAVGVLLLVDALLIRLLLRADETQVWFLDQPIAWVCGMRRSLGLPCPTCGLTRSVVLTLQGDLARAWSIAPAGLLIAFGLVAFGGGLVAGGRMPSWMRRAAWIYGILLVLVWIAGWAMSFAQQLR